MLQQLLYSHCNTVVICYYTVNLAISNCISFPLSVQDSWIQLYCSITFGLFLYIDCWWLINIWSALKDRKLSYIIGCGLESPSQAPSGLTIYHVLIIYRVRYRIKKLFHRGIFTDYPPEETKAFLKVNVTEYEIYKDDQIKSHYISTLERAEDFFVHTLSFEKVCIAWSLSTAQTQHAQYFTLLLSSFNNMQIN